VHFVALTIPATSPLQLVVSYANDPVKVCIIIVYFVIGDPFALGATQLMIASLPTTLVIGATGLDGTVATRIVTVLENKDRP